MNFMKNLRNITRSQTKPCSAPDTDSLITHNFPDFQPENVLTSQSSLKSKDKATSCQPKVRTVCGDRHQPVVRAQAPITGGVRAPVETSPELLASWEEIEELEDDVRALKAALRVKDNKMKKICVEYDAKIEKIQSDCFNPVPISPCVPMPAPASSHCNTKADNMRNMHTMI